MPNLSGEKADGQSELLKSSTGALHTTDGTWTALGYEQITSMSSVKSLTVPAGARFAHLQAESKSVRYRDDGTNPSATVGNRIFADDIGLVYPGDLAAIRFIETAASAKLNVHYYS